MVDWILIAIVIVAVIVVSKFIHFKHLKHKLTAILIILLIVFAYVTFTTLVKAHSIDLKSASGVYSAVKAYVAWFGLAFDNMKTLTGNVIKMDWFPSNYTQASSSKSKPAEIEYA